MANTFKFDLKGLFPSLEGTDPFSMARATKKAGHFTGIDDPSQFHLVGLSSIADANDKPFFVLMAREGQALHIDVDNANFDSRVYVLDTLGNVVAQSDNSGATDSGSPSGDDPLLDFTVPKTGFYTVFVTSFDNTYLGNFHFGETGTAFGSFQLDMSTNALPSLVDLGIAANIFSDSANVDHNVFANAGNDRVTLSGNSNDIVDGGDGNDTLNVGPGNDVANGGAGSDQISGLAGDDVIDGGDGDDGIQGGTEDDQLSGGAGNDVIVGDTGNDLLFGGAGNDVLIPGLGDDYVDGGSGSDTLSFLFSPNAVTVDLRTGTAAGEGSDKIAGIGILQGSPNNDVLIGDGRDNQIFGQNGDDSITGNAGNDTLNGEGDNDVVSGDGGWDLVVGGDGNDVLKGGAGRDTLNGGDGDDLLRGGLDSDESTGGTGADTFSYGRHDAPLATEFLDKVEKIVDFNQSVDDIAIEGMKYFIGTDAFSHRKGEVAYSQHHDSIVGDTTTVVGDLDGDGSADFQLVIQGLFTLHATDFVLF